MSMTITDLSFDVEPAWGQSPPDVTHKDVPGVAVDSQDNVFLFTRHDSQVVVFDSNGQFQYTWGRGMFANAHGITIAPDDSVYCVDNKDHTVRKFTPEGKLLMTLGTPDVPSDTGFHDDDLDTITCGGSPFNKCTNLAVAPNGDLYVADGYGNARVHRFSATGDLLQSWGEPGIGPGQFHLPHGIWVTPDERVLIADRENDRIQFFDLNGEFLHEWTDVLRPCAVQSDADGFVYVAELNARPGVKSYVHGDVTEDKPGRVSIFDGNGSLAARWGSLEEPCAPGNFVAPHGLSLDSKGNLYIAEVTWTISGRRGLVGPDCHQIQKFIRSGKPGREPAAVA